MEKTIRKIHKKFDTASEKLLAEAKAIVSAPVVNDTKTIERLHKIGFNTAKPIKDAEEMFKRQEKAKETIEAIEYYQLHYPNYKFISEEQIQAICKKYGLLYGESKNYLGAIPEKNLTEIEAFKLREEDYYEDTYFSLWSSMVGQRLFAPSFSFLDGTLHLDYGTRATEELKETAKQKPPFKICAPKKDFNTSGYEVKDGYKLVYDPIVIQPVKYKNLDGGLVISKWGIEGQDESLVNEKMN